MTTGGPQLCLPSFHSDCQTGFCGSLTTFSSWQVDIFESWLNSPDYHRAGLRDVRRSVQPILVLNTASSSMASTRLCSRSPSRSPRFPLGPRSQNWWRHTSPGFPHPPSSSGTPFLPCVSSPTLPRSRYTFGLTPISDIKPLRPCSSPFPAPSPATFYRRISTPYCHPFPWAPSPQIRLRRRS